MPNKMERFTQRARHVLSLAQETAEKMKHPQIHTGHILLALMRADGGVAERVLRSLKVDKKQVEEEVNHRTEADGKRFSAQLELGADTRKLLEMAVDEAHRMGHHYISTEHFLLGITRLPDTLALTILQDLNISPEIIRQETRRILQESPFSASESPTSQPEVVLKRISDVLDELDVIRREIRPAAREAAASTETATLLEMIAALTTAIHQLIETNQRLEAKLDNVIARIQSDVNHPSAADKGAADSEDNKKTHNES